ncbi:MAG TPA: hypothetical protein VGE39_26400 [Prosthecobacter sp.]
MKSKLLLLTLIVSMLVLTPGCMTWGIYHNTANPNPTLEERTNAIGWDLVTLPLQVVAVPMAMGMAKLSMDSYERSHARKVAAHEAYEQKQNAAYAAARQQREKQKTQR